MSTKAELFDGTVLEFEDGTPDDVIDRVSSEETDKLRSKEAQRPLPAGVEPSTAGAGRGGLGGRPDVAEPAGLASARPARRGTMRAVEPYGALEPTGGTGRGVIEPPLAEDHGQVDSDGNPIRPEIAQALRKEPEWDTKERLVSAGKLKRDLLAGVEDTKALASSAASLGGVISRSAAAMTLQDFDALDAGKPPTSTATQERTLSGKMQPGQPNAVVQDYRNALPEDRAKMRDQLIQSMARDKEFVAEAQRNVLAYAKKSQELSGKVPEFTDIKSLTGFANWLAETGVKGAPTMAAAMVAAMFGPIGFVVGSGGMAVGDINQARIEHAAKVNDPKRFRSADRAAEAAAGFDEAVASYQAEHADATLALSFPYAALDTLGPVGRALRGASAEIKKATLRQVLVRGAKDLPEQIIEEIGNEGGQEVVNVLGDILAKERPPNITAEDAKRILNAAMAGAAMAPGGHAVNVAKEVYQTAKANGFNVVPPFFTDDATTRRAKTIGIFENLAAQYGIPADVVGRATKNAKDMPAEKVGPFFAALVDSLQKRSLAPPVDGHAIDTLTAGPVDDPKVLEQQAKEAEKKAKELADESAKGTTSAAGVANAEGAVDGAPPQGSQTEAAPGAGAGVPGDIAAKQQAVSNIESILAPKTTDQIDEAAHQAATSPQNNLPEPTDAQKEAGNYQKGHVVIDGMDVSIENPKDSVRRSKADAAVPWEVTMPYHYGYIRGTEGSDGDHVDLGIGPKGNNGRYWVINQNHEKGGHDEHKVFTGVDSPEEAVKLYKASFTGGFGDKLFGSISQEFTADQLKAKLPSMSKAKPVLGVAKKSPVRELSLQAQRDAGWDTNWPFIPADLLNSDFRQLLRDDPSLSDEEKARVFAAGNKLGVVPAAEAGKSPVISRQIPGQSPVISRQIPGQSPANGPRIVGHAGTTPKTASPIELRANPDGSLTPFHGGHELLDYETGDPIKLQADITDAAAVEAIKAAKAFGRKTKFYDAKEEPAAPTEEKPDAQAVRSDEGQVRQGGAEGQPSVQRGPEQGGGDLQQQAQGKPGDVEKPTEKAKPAEAAPARPEQRQKAVTKLTDEEAFSNDYAAFEGKTVEQKVPLSDTSEPGVLRIDAATAMRAFDKRMDALEKLKTCIAKAA